MGGGRRGTGLASQNHHSNVSYQSFTQLHDENDVVINVVPSQATGARSWQHYINDLDFFFAKIYKYHRYAGFPAIVIRYTTQLLEFLFVICLTFVVINCIDYDTLFSAATQRRTFRDIFVPPDLVRVGSVQCILLIIALFSLLVRILKVIRKLFVYRGIGQFYADALRIRDCTLFTWPEVQARLIATERVCLFQGKRITELDIHNRILRRKNYMIALINKELLPIFFYVPFIGDIIYLPKGLQYYFNFILFKAPFIRLFETNWKLKDEYKQIGRRDECAAQFRRNCFRFSLFMAVFGIFFTFWQLLNLFYRYADEIKTNPGRVFAFRRWTPYARLYCRHFNELDHNLEDRLNKGHRPATKYMNSFISVPLESCAKLVLFMSRAMAAVLGILTLYSEHVLGVEHMLSVLAGLIFVGFACNGFIRNDVPQKHTQIELYEHVLSHIHYVPAHHPPATPQARAQIGVLFGYKILGILEELICPLVAWYIVARHLSSKSVALVDFFRNCSIEIPGIGDVCSFSMLNIDKNGNPAVRQAIEKPKGGMSRSETGDSSLPNAPSTSSANLQEVSAEQMEQREPFVGKPCVPTQNGKLELSLINFKLMNPSWRPIDSQAQFIQSFQHDLQQATAISMSAGQSRILFPPTNAESWSVQTSNDFLTGNLRSPPAASFMVQPPTGATNSARITASLIPRTPYSSMINPCSDPEDPDHFESGLLSPESNMSINSIFFRHRLAEIAADQSTDRQAETSVSLPQSVPLQTYTDSQIL